MSSVSLSALLAATLWGGLCTSTRASVIVSETFSYGATAGSLVGQNGGTGFSGAWNAAAFGDTDWQYTPTGLTFGSMSVTGGAATHAGGFSSTERQFSTSLATSLYGSFLFRINERSADGSTASLILGKENDFDWTASLAIKAPEYGASTAALIREDTLPNEPAVPINIGTTYLALYQLDTDGSATAWLLTENQYDYFMGGGSLTPSALNNATLGSSTTSVIGRMNQAEGDYDPITHLGLFIYGYVDVTYDELRISNSSLAQAAPGGVPEPSRGLLLLGGGTLCLLRRRRKS